MPLLKFIPLIALVLSKNIEGVEGQITYKGEVRSVEKILKIEVIREQVMRNWLMRNMQ